MSPCAFTPSICHVDLGAIRRNLLSLGPAERMMPVVKSDAYGHGLIPVARTLEAAGVRRFAVGCAAEGAALREAGLTCRRVVPLLGLHSRGEWDMARAAGLTPPLLDFDDLDAAAAAADGGTLDVAVKLETGMGRLGFSREDIPALLEALRARPALRPVLAISHLAVADESDDDAAGFTRGQLAAFAAMTDALRGAFPEMERSLGNSAATLAWPEAAFEVVRPGYAVYGGNPLAGTAWEDRGGGLEWAMSLSAPVLQTHPLAAGGTVSYGRRFRAPRDMRVAVLGCGYASGVSRGLSGRMEVLLRGRRVRQLGTVCMGMILVDATDVPEVRRGDRAWLLGGEAADGERPVTPGEWGALLGTIPYEILCLVGATNPREHRA